MSHPGEISCSQPCTAANCIDLAGKCVQRCLTDAKINRRSQKDGGTLKH